MTGSFFIIITIITYTIQNKIKTVERKFIIKLGLPVIDLKIAHLTMQMERDEEN